MKVEIKCTTKLCYYVYYWYFCIKFVIYFKIFILLSCEVYYISMKCNFILLIYLINGLINGLNVGLSSLTNSMSSLIFKILVVLPIYSIRIIKYFNYTFDIPISRDL